MTQKKAPSKRYLLSMMPETFRHLEEVAATQSRRSGQFVTVASLIRDAIQATYPMNNSEQKETTK